MLYVLSFYNLGYSFTGTKPILNLVLTLACIAEIVEKNEQTSG